MERKVIQLAGKTLVVSLPSKWAREYGVRKGDTVFVEEVGNSILIKTRKEIDIEKTSIVLKGPYEFIKRSIDVSYKKGVDELNLSFDSPKTIGIIEEVLESTMGFEIISHSKRNCLVKSVAAAVQDEFDNILRRVFLIILSIAEESYESLLDSKLKRLDDIIKYDKTVNKLTNFCKRILNKRGYKEQKHSNYIYCIIWELERIADEYGKICRQLSSQKNAKISKEVLQLYKETNEMLREFYNIFYKFSQEKGIELTNMKNKLSKKCESLIPKKKGNDSVLLHHLSNIITSTYDIAGPYYAMIL